MAPSARCTEQFSVSRPIQLLSLESEVYRLDPTRTDAWTPRPTLWMTRGGAGEPMPEPWKGTP
jgi:hypothetical protein